MTEQSQKHSGIDIRVSIILLLATLLVFHRLASQSLWYDEGFSIYMAKLPLLEILTRTAQDIHPPFYYWLLHFWLRLTGDSPFAVRALSALTAVLNVALVYRLCRTVWDQHVGELAAFCMALSPLALYYAQETRMYALVTMLGLASTYVLLLLTRAPDSPQEPYLWLIYVGLNLAGAYTHYFYVLLLSCHLLYATFCWWQAGHPQAFAARVLSSLLLWCVGYAIWVPVILDRYRNDAGYLAAALAPLDALQRILASFSLGPVTRGPLPTTLVIAGYLVALGIGTMTFFGANRRQHDRALAAQILVWLYLLAPLLPLLWLYHHKARLNPHHIMFITPAFFGLIAAGIVSLWRRGNAQVSRARSWLYYGVAAILFFFVTASAAWADWQYYYNSLYLRPDFRGAVNHICSRLQLDQAVILVSGHMFPIFDYYCPGRVRYPIPDSPVLNVKNRVGFEVTDVLQQATQGKLGVWMLLWQNIFVDPADIVGSLLLEQSLGPPGVATANQVTVRYYELRNGAQFAWNEGISFPVTARWELGRVLVSGKVTLQPTGAILEAAHANKGEFRAGESLQLTLYWRALGPLDKSYDVFVHVEDERGIIQSQHDGVPAGAKKPTDSWRADELVVDRHRVEIKPTMKPGKYRVVVGLYDAHAPGLPKLLNQDVLLGWIDVR